MTLTMPERALPPVEQPGASDFPELTARFEAQRRAFQAAGSPGLAERRQNLNRLAQLVACNRMLLADALRDDFGARSSHETAIAEIAASIHSVRYAQRHLRSWMRPRRRSTPLWFFPAGNRVVPQPRGVVGVMSPWNYPVHLTVAPLAAALAAGNRVLVRMSELTPATATLLGKLVAETFPPEQVTVVTGGADHGRAFAALPFDHLLFTGSTAVGREVALAAAANLTPVTLELGGKSPVIIDDDYPLERAAERIVWGKLFNAGQTCIAPDYVLVPRGRERDFAAAAGAVARRLQPALAGNADVTAVVDERHYRRLRELVDDAVARGAHVEAAADPIEGENERKLPLTMIIDPPEGTRVMEEEVFGPVLPVVGYGSLADALERVNARPRPLALYLFTRSRRLRDHVLAGTTSGGMCVNDTMLHYLQDDLPFGGVGSSGMGAYHGREGFDACSHLKAVLVQRDLAGHTGVRLLYPPYGRLADLLVRLMRHI